MPIRPSDEELRKLQDLKDLLQFGLQQFSDVNIGWFQIKKRKQLLFQMFTAVHSQVESISILLETGRTFSVEILLRPVQETLINANYILVGRNNLTVNRFLVGSNHKLMKQITKMITYISNNPHYDTGSPALSLQELKKVLLRRDKETREYIRPFRYRIPLKEPSVEERVIAIDKEFVRLRHRQPNTSQQWTYLTQYWLASEQVHLSARGLMNYTGLADDKVVLFLDGDKSDIDKYIVIASAMYLDMLYTINSQFKLITRQQLDVWREKIRQNSIPNSKDT